VVEERFINVATGRRRAARARHRAPHRAMDNTSGGQPGMLQPLMSLDEFEFRYLAHQ